MDYMKDMRVFNDTNSVYRRCNGYTESESQIQYSYEEIWAGIVAAVYTLASMPHYN